MRKELVLTLTGHDRVGLVEHVTRLVLDCGGNVEASRMARLGGEFAMLMLVSVSDLKLNDLKQVISSLQNEGFTVCSCQTEAVESSKYAGWLPYQLEVNGADHEGIIHHIAHHLATYNINIEHLDTDMVKAPMSGAPLFVMTAVVYVQPNLSYRQLQTELNTLGDTLNVDIKFLPYTGN
jgi:glycine cleavage system transcriptional repressor